MIIDTDVACAYLTPIMAWSDLEKVDAGIKKGEISLIGASGQISPVAITGGKPIGKSNVMLKYLEYMSPMERLDYLAQVAEELRGKYDLEYSDEKPEPTNVLPNGRARFVDLDYNETFAKLLARAKVKHGQK